MKYTKKQLKEHIENNTIFVDKERVIKKKGKEVEFIEFSNKLTFRGEIVKEYKNVGYDVYVY